MKISKLKTTQIDKPFIDDGKIYISFIREKGHKITSMKLRNKKKELIVKVIKDDILSAFKKAEKFFSKI